MSKHTPTPWRMEGPIKNLNGGFEIYTVEEDRGRAWIASINGTHVGPRDWAEIEANARLLFEAPALKAMVESLLGHAEDCVRDHYAPTGHDYPDPDIITDARKLLRRIAGKEDTT